MRRRGRGAIRISHFSISDFSRMLITVPCVRRPCGASEESHEDGPARASESERDGDAVAARVAVGAAEGLHPFTN